MTREYSWELGLLYMDGDKPYIITERRETIYLNKNDIGEVLKGIKWEPINGGDKEAGKEAWQACIGFLCRVKTRDDK